MRSNLPSLAKIFTLPVSLSEAVYVVMFLRMVQKLSRTK